MAFFHLSCFRKINSLYKMRIRKLHIIILLKCITACQILSAQQVMTARISTEILPPIRLEENQRLRFGAFALVDQQGSISLTANNERVATGRIQLIESQYNAGKFTIFSKPGSIVTLSLPKQCIRLSIENGRYCFLLNNFTANIPECGVFACNQNGITEVQVGATLNTVDPGSLDMGLSSNTYEVVFMYN